MFFSQNSLHSYPHYYPIVLPNAPPPPQVLDSKYSIPRKPTTALVNHRRVDSRANPQPEKDNTINSYYAAPREDLLSTSRTYKEINTAPNIQPLIPPKQPYSRPQTSEGRTSDYPIQLDDPKPLSSLESLRIMEYQRNLDEITVSRRKGKLGNFVFRRLRMSKLPPVRKPHETYGPSFSEYRTNLPSNSNYSPLTVVPSQNQPDCSQSTPSHQTHSSSSPYWEYFQDVRLPRPVMLRHANVAQINATILGKFPLTRVHTPIRTPNGFSPGLSPNLADYSPFAHVHTYYVNTSPSSQGPSMVSPNALVND
ncbi:hypothetical protein BLNAU_59 [Blattamonas nauphoetae]|uniref:Uncharacterized protein n=1 Tax=Blattamonas nauphoetae TaxID=2049346 RepID=A0ABQ9YMJ7_9EUKA|nr:hypothetical protein BLNAU_59 [Blattamonas nauphoetae]